MGSVIFSSLPRVERGASQRYQNLFQQTFLMTTRPTFPHPQPRDPPWNWACRKEPPCLLSQELVAPPRAWTVRPVSFCLTKGRAQRRNIRRTRVSTRRRRNTSTKNRDRMAFVIDDWPVLLFAVCPTNTAIHVITTYNP